MSRNDIDFASPDEPQLLRVTDHWETSLGLARSAVVFSDLPWGASPVASQTRVLNFVIDGTEHYELDGRTYVVRQGEFLMLDAGVQGRATMASKGRTRGLCIYLPVTPAEAGVRPTSDREPSPLEVRAFQMSSAGSDFGRLLMSAGRHLAQHGVLSANATVGLVDRTRCEMSQLHGSLATELMRIDAAKPSTRRDILQRVHRAREYLHGHASETVTLDRLARTVGMSQFHLARSFKAVFGVPPARYHSAQRIVAVADALKAGHISVIDASFSAGFADASSFSRAFKRVTGSAPSGRRSLSR